MSELNFTHTPRIVDLNKNVREIKATNGMTIGSLVISQLTWSFKPAPNFAYGSAELREIADKIDEMNEVTE